MSNAGGAPVVTPSAVPVMDGQRELWPVGPPHVFDGPRSAPGATVCPACGFKKDRVIHSAVYWARQRQVALVSPDAYRRWAHPR